MKKIASMFLTALLLVSFSACAAPAVAEPTPAAQPTPTAKPAEYHKMSPVDAKARLDSGDELILLDVRTKEEFDAGHIPGAVLLPNDKIVDTPPELLPDLNAEILIYCRSGNRSAQAANKLVAMGYTNVYDFGGIIDWPYEVVTD